MDRMTMFPWFIRRVRKSVYTMYSAIIHEPGMGHLELLLHRDQPKQQVRLEVYNQSPTRLGYLRGNAVLRWLRHLSQGWRGRANQRPLRIRVHLGDGVDEHHRRCAGIDHCLAFSAPPDAQTLLIPDPDFLLTQGYAALRRTIQQRDCPFWHKTSWLYWRGGSTGPCIAVPADLDLNQRTHACRLLPRTVPCCDVRLSNICQVRAPEMEAHLQPLLGRIVGKREQLRHRYLLDLDGNSNAWSGLFWKLYSNSVVIKVQSPYRQWYYGHLRDGVNVFLATSVRDVARVMRRARRNPRLAARVARRATLLAQRLTYERESARFRRVLARQFGVDLVS